MNGACNGIIFLAPPPEALGRGQKVCHLVWSVRLSVHLSRYLLSHLTKSNQIFFVRVAHINGACNGIMFWAQLPGALGRGKYQISLNFNYKVNFKDFKLNFVCLLTNERYITYPMGFSFGRLGGSKGGTWGVGEGGRGGQ